MFKFKRIAGMTAIHGLMLLGAATAWAGRGDIDPNYGDRGQLAPGSGTVLSLPDGRLLIDATDTEDAFKVRLVDADGRDVQTFGDGGHAAIPVPAATPSFMPTAATLGPNGEMYIEGLLWAREQGHFFEAILRLNATGQPELSFGGQGDGFLRMTDLPIEYTPDWKTTLAAFTVDPVGRVVVAQHGWTPGNVCSGPMALRRFLTMGEPDLAFGTAGSVEIPDVDFCAGAPLFGARGDSSMVVGDGRTIVAIDATGTIDVGFGADGRVDPLDSGWTAGFQLPDESLLIYHSIDESTGSADAIISKFARNGRVDTAFGSGTGLVHMDLTLDYPGAGGIRGVIDRLLLAPDTPHLLAQITTLRADGARFCVGIARFSIDGTLDDQFGRRGLTCLDHGSLAFFLLSVQGNGAPLFQLDGPANIFRLLPDDMPSPGIITGVGTWQQWVDESAGEIVHGFMRVAGRDGAVSIDYSASQVQIGPGDYYYREPYHLRNATAGADFEEKPGQLDWASGEDGERVARVKIFDDSVPENNEVFALRVSNPTGGATVVGAGGILGIRNDDSAPNPPPVPPAQGGGGALNGLVIFLLTILAFGSRLRRRFVGM